MHNTKSSRVRTSDFFQELQRTIPTSTEWVMENEWGIGEETDDQEQKSKETIQNLLEEDELYNNYYRRRSNSPDAHINEVKKSKEDGKSNVSYPPYLTGKPKKSKRPRLTSEAEDSHETQEQKDSKSVATPSKPDTMEVWPVEEEKCITFISHFAHFVQKTA